MEQRNLAFVSIAILLAALFCTGSSQELCPHISRVVPDVSLATSAREILIEGENFEKGSLVYLGSRLLHRVTVVDGRRLRARLPRDLDAGTFPVRVVVPGRREDTVASGVTFLPSETTPVVVSVTPSRIGDDGPAGLVLRGHNFRPDSRVFLGTSRRLRVKSLTSTRLEALLAACPPPGRYDVRVVAPDGEAGTLHEGLTVVGTDAL